MPVEVTVAPAEVTASDVGRPRPPWTWAAVLVPAGRHRHESEVGQYLTGTHGHTEAGGGGATPHQGPDERADEGGEGAYREGLRAGGAAEAVRGVARADHDEGCDEGHAASGHRVCAAASRSRDERSHAL